MVRSSPSRRTAVTSSATSLLDEGRAIARKHRTKLQSEIRRRIADKAKLPCGTVVGDGVAPAVRMHRLRPRCGKVDDREPPVAEPEPGPGEVRVRLRASGVNPSDVKARAGGTRKIAFPRIIPHSDGAGEIGFSRTAHQPQ